MFQRVINMLNSQPYLVWKKEV